MSPVGAAVLLKSPWLGIHNCSYATERTYKRTRTYMYILFIHVRPTTPDGYSKGSLFKDSQFGVFSASRPCTILVDSRSVNEGEW